MNYFKSLLICSMPLLLVSACSNKENKQLPPREVPVVTVSTRTLTGFSSYPTSIEGRNNNEVRAKISGYITEVLVDEGQHVGQGQPLFRLETNTLSESANAAKSGIAAAQANVDAAQASVKAAQIEVDKLEPLVERKIISDVQLNTAKANLLKYQGQLSQAKAAYIQSKANYNSIVANIDYAVIRAPISGVVGKINMRKGSLVGPSDPTPITKISDTRELFAYFSMNESDYLDFISKINGQSISEKLNNLPLVELILANGSLYSEKGKISTVTGQISPETGTIQFRASFPNNEGMLTNGNTGIIRIPKQYNDALIIPESSLFENQGNIFAFKVSGDSVQSVLITLLDKVNNLAIISSGLQKGEVVVAKGVGNLKTGMKIKPKHTDIDSIINEIKPIF